MSIHSIHHVTAITGKIADNHRFYTQGLGLRLVKKTVNQDDVSAYHLFYADEVGSPGSDMTFFDWAQLPRRTPGAAEASLTTFRIPTESVSLWDAHLQTHGISVLKSIRSDGRTELRFEDAEGQRLALVEDRDWPQNTTPWTKVVPSEQAITGILGVDLCSARPESTERVLKEILGYEWNGEHYATQDDRHYAELRIIDGSELDFARQGAGAVHHVAFRVEDRDELLEIGGLVEKMGLRTSGFIDRYYFQSLYFREPGGVLFELATDGPGFASDEPQASLGERLSLPPFLEGRRKEIEAGLKPLDV